MSKKILSMAVLLLAMSQHQQSNAIGVKQIFGLGHLWATDGGKLDCTPVAFGDHGFAVLAGTPQDMLFQKNCLNGAMVLDAPESDPREVQEEALKLKALAAQVEARHATHKYTVQTPEGTTCFVDVSHFGSAPDSLKNVRLQCDDCVDTDGTPFHLRAALDVQVNEKIKSNVFYAVPSKDGKSILLFFLNGTVLLVYDIWNPDVDQPAEETPPAAEAAPERTAGAAE